MGVTDGRWPADPAYRAAAAAAAGLRAGTAGAEAVVALEGLVATDPDPRVRSVALGALVRLAGRRAGAAWRAALGDEAATVRRRACELAPAVRPRGCAGLVAALGDPDAAVAEAAAFALGELGRAALAAGAVGALAAAAGGLAAVLRACGDRPSVRRRAVVALAAFEGPEVEAALRAALDDRDWQVRQAAEDLLGPGSPSPG